MLTSTQLVDFCEKVYKAGWVYWYGTYGNRCTLSKYEAKKAQYPSHYTSSRTAAYMKDIAEGRICADCVGLIKAFFWTGGEVGAEPKYKSNNCPDVSANGMIALCSETGPISTIPDIPGLVVWKDGHIGVYIGDGYTIEMRGFAYDCVKRKVKDGPWVKWGRLPASMIAYEDGTSSSADAPPSPQGEGKGDAPDISLLGKRTLKKGKGGADVAQLQSALIWLGYDCGKWGADGDFGSATDRALRAFQRDAGIEVDGVFGPMSLKALKTAMANKGTSSVSGSAGATFPIGEGNGNGTPEPEPKPDPGIALVEITGDSVNVRSGPGTDGTRVIGIAYKGDRLPYQGEVRNVDGRDWYLVEFALQNGWVSSKYARLIDGGGDGDGRGGADHGGDVGGASGPEPLTRGTKICDISKHQPTVDYDAFIADTELIILRAGYRKSDGKVYEDECFRQHAEALLARGVRFGVFFYSWADTEAKAREEARKFVEYASAYRPLFWAVDLEKPEITQAAIRAFADELRALVGDEKLGAYVAHHHYRDYRFDEVRGLFDFIWIPNYLAKPDWPCDLWQYTSGGAVGGINRTVDLNRITGEGHGLEWFTE